MAIAPGGSKRPQRGMNHPLAGPALVALFVGGSSEAGAAAAARSFLENAEDRARFDAAISLHDRGEYDAAASAFRDLLAAHPDDPTLLCEMANSLMSAGKSEEAITHAERGLKQPGAGIAFCSTVLGTALDAHGDFEKGEKVFRKAIRKTPDVPLLHFNLGVNQTLQKHPGKAIEEFQEASRLNPAHASSWRALAIAWQSQRMRPRAFAAFARFLALEPSGPRAKEAAAQLEALLFEGVENKGIDPTTGKDSTHITLDIDSGAKSDATGALGLAMSVVAAGRWTEEWKDQNDATFFAHAFDTVLAIFEETGDVDGRKDEFWNGWVMPYFRDARAAGHLTALSWELRRSREDAEVSSWLEAHATEVEAYRTWSAAWKPDRPRSPR